MTDPIRRDDERPGDAAADASAFLSQAVRLAVGLGALPLLGLLAAWSQPRRGPPQADPDASERDATPAAPNDLPPRADVEAALARMTEATRPKSARSGKRPS